MSDFDIAQVKIEDLLKDHVLLQRLSNDMFDVCRKYEEYGYKADEVMSMIKKELGRRYVENNTVINAVY